MSEKSNFITNKTSVNKALTNVDLKYKQNKIKFALQVNQLNTGRIQSEQEMEDRINQLFELCQKTRQCSHLRISCCCLPVFLLELFMIFRLILMDMNGWKEYSQILKRAKDTISLMENTMAADGSIPSAVWIFRAKNYQQMKDVQQIEAVASNQGDVPTNADDMVATLPEAPDVIEVDSKKD